MVFGFILFSLDLVAILILNEHKCHTTRCFVVLFTCNSGLFFLKVVSFLSYNVECNKRLLYIFIKNVLPAVKDIFNSIKLIDLPRVPAICPPSMCKLDTNMTNVGCRGGEESQYKIFCICSICPYCANLYACHKNKQHVTCLITAVY